MTACEKKFFFCLLLGWIHDALIHFRQSTFTLLAFSYLSFGIHEILYVVVGKDVYFASYCSILPYGTGRVLIPNYSPYEQ